ncbi:MAG: type II toxin-antitoxin system HicB family antitoxin [Methylococcales bacterium]|nr:type II toxin-antitoxin system HicB family antitoxin [Methylococcales bacterium]
MLCYPAILEKDPETGTVMVSFPDIPFAHSVGDDEAEALLNAEAALVTAFEICEEKREAIPISALRQPHGPLTQSCCAATPTIPWYKMIA